MRDEKTEAQIKKKLWDNTHLLSPHPHLDKNQPPGTYSIPPVIHNNNKMDTEFLVQMRQSNKCGSIRNDEIFNLHLGSDSCIKNWTVLLVVLKKFVSVIYLILKRSIENCFCREPHPPWQVTKWESLILRTVPAIKLLYTIQQLFYIRANGSLFFDTKQIGKNIPGKIKKVIDFFCNYTYYIN